MTTSTPFQTKSRYFQLDRWKMHYLDAGEGDPIVMLHGNPTWAYFFRHLLVTLRSSYQVIACDHLGCGLSSKPATGSYTWSLAQRITDITSFISTVCGKRRVTLIMHDWGTAIGMGYATRYPSRIKRLVIMNGAAFHLPASRRFPWQLRLFKNKLLGKFLVQRCNLFLNAVLLTCSTQKLPSHVADAYRQPYRSYRDREAMLRFIDDIPLTATDRSFGLLSEIEKNLASLKRLPILLCWGKKDFIFNRDFFQQWETYFPRAKVREYEHCGHLLLEDDPELIGNDIKAFMQEN